MREQLLIAAGKPSIRQQRAIPGPSHIRKQSNREI